MLFDIKQTGIDSRQINILNELDYFSDFGNTRELSVIISLFDFMSWGDAKEIAKSKIEPDSDLYDAIVSHSVGANGNGKEYKKWHVLDAKAVLLDMEQAVKKRSMEDYDITYKIKCQMEYLGHIASSGNNNDRSTLVVKEAYPLKRKKDGKQFGYSFVTCSIGSGMEMQYMTVRMVGQPVLTALGACSACLVAGNGTSLISSKV